MLLKALIVRSTTQKGEKPFRTRAGQFAGGYREPESGFTIACMERTG
jgi:hypothetical protein